MSCGGTSEGLNERAGAHVRETVFRPFARNPGYRRAVVNRSDTGRENRTLDWNDLGELRNSE